MSGNCAPWAPLIECTHLLVSFYYSKCQVKSQPFLSIMANWNTDLLQESRPENQVPTENLCSFGLVQTPLFSLGFITPLKWLLYPCLLTPQNMSLRAFLLISQCSLKDTESPKFSSAYPFYRSSRFNSASPC